MKAIGIIRHVDKLGRIVIPREVTKTMSIDSNTELEILVDEYGNLVLQKYKKSCIFCGKKDNIIEYQNKCVCKECVIGLKEV